MARARRLCVFQMHHDEADERLLEVNAVRPVVESGLFDHVALALADVPENRALARWAGRWGIDVVHGSERDVARRILDCARRYDCDVIARALVWWFFLDLDLVQAELELLESSDAERVDLPRDFDLRFGADVFRACFLERVRDDLDQVERRSAADPSLGGWRRNPWSWAETHPERFRARTCAALPTYDRARFDELRARMRGLWPERWDGAGSPLVPYRIACELLPTGGSALDAACGLGAGSAFLAERGSVVGVDLSRATIERCRARYGEALAERASFVTADLLELELESERFDVAVSVHTLEHLRDERTFLARLARWLRPGGRLVLEVPLLMRRPFVGIETPLSPDHLREYEVDALRALVAEHFEIERCLGVARGTYLPIERARNAALIVGRVRKGRSASRSAA
jgi:SAM-dependent methyltransferase